MTSPTAPRRQTKLRLTDAEHAAAVELAAELDVSVNRLIRAALAAYVEQYRHSPTLPLPELRRVDL